MTRKVDCDEEEESGQEDSTTSDDERDRENPGIKDVWIIFPKHFQQNMLLNCCITWPPPKISCFGHAANNHSENNAYTSNKHLKAGWVWLYNITCKKFRMILISDKPVYILIVSEKTLRNILSVRIFYSTVKKTFKVPVK